MDIFTGFLSRIVGVATGGLADAVLDVIKGQFPDKLSEAERAAIAERLHRLEFERSTLAQSHALEASEALTKRISELEGTASDLRSVPVLGAVMLFLRGSQRPVWGFATLYLDFHAFSGQWALSDMQAGAFWAVNVLVLGFLFGERAVMNVLPALEKLKGG